MWFCECLGRTRARGFPDEGRLLLILCAALGAGCRSPGPHATAGGSHSLAYTNVPRAFSSAPALTGQTNPPAAPGKFQKWNPVWWFGNVDDPVPTPDYRPNDPHRQGKWYCRNSLHNFTFYVVGIADKPFVRTGRSPAKVFHPDGGWNWAVCRHRWWRLPFVSYQRGRFKFYLGWRERGNFGAKLNL